MADGGAIFSCVSGSCITGSAHPFSDDDIWESHLSAAGGGGQSEPAADSRADLGELFTGAAAGLQLHHRGRRPHGRQTADTQVRWVINFGSCSVDL